MVASPHPSLKSEVVSEQAIRNEIRQMAATLKNNMDQMSMDDRDAYHARLIELGYEHVWHEVWVEHALRKNDIVKALQYSVKLSEKLTKNEMPIISVMERYAQLLETTLHFKESQEVCNTIFEIKSDYNFKINTTRLERNRKIVQAGNFIVDLTGSSVNMEQIIGSHTVLEKIFSWPVPDKKAQSCNL